ncbi:zinc ribbon domain-containing protein ['Paenibacillus yunnanensis' Narsing Rao et al. 2020]|uniref:zinc ribbon domain-containing protein n=1 Tax=Paenibacillus tengchongensis TaxID=2608684 RepID=UPI00124C5C3C|nr:zinc ribbon domain-containing protein [Paenibacillus tengchongensis]
MSFFDKFKAGVSEAGNKAKSVVEINRLKLQNNGKQNEIDKQYQAMGRLLFETTLQGVPLEKADYAVHMERVLVLQSEIDANLQQIAELGDAKQCRNCGTTVDSDARFCPNCGATFDSAAQFRE